MDAGEIKRRKKSLRQLRVGLPDLRKAYPPARDCDLVLLRELQEEDVKPSTEVAKAKSVSTRRDIVNAKANKRFQEKREYEIRQKEVLAQKRREDEAICRKGDALSQAILSSRPMYMQPPLEDGCFDNFPLLKPLEAKQMTPQEVYAYNVQQQLRKLYGEDTVAVNGNTHIDYVS